MLALSELRLDEVGGCQRYRCRRDCPQPQGKLLLYVNLGVDKIYDPSGIVCVLISISHPIRTKARVGRLRSKIAMSEGSITEPHNDSVDLTTPTVYAVTTTYARPVQGGRARSEILRLAAKNIQVVTGIIL